MVALNIPKSTMEPLPVLVTSGWFDTDDNASSLIECPSQFQATTPHFWQYFSFPSGLHEAKSKI